MKSFTHAVALLFLALVALVSASPVTKRDVFVPHITNPHAGTILRTGQRYNVTWETDDAPAQITNPIGKIVLAKAGRLIGIENPIAQGFNILQGWQEITVPVVDTAFDYSFVLFGDSGNFSPEFPIIHVLELSNF